ncbi:MAG: hypothetical protein ACJASM_002651 [Salibacteraceae bacterium]|jgi:hypothetical protein
MGCEYTKKVFHNSDHFDFEITIIKCKVQNNAYKKPKKLEMLSGLLTKVCEHKT